MRRLEKGIDSVYNVIMLLHIEIHQNRLQQLAVLFGMLLVKQKQKYQEDNLYLLHIILSNI